MFFTSLMNRTYHALFLWRRRSIEIGRFESGLVRLSASHPLFSRPSPISAKAGNGGEAAPVLHTATASDRRGRTRSIPCALVLQHTAHPQTRAASRLRRCRSSGQGWASGGRAGPEEQAHGKIWLQLRNSARKVPTAGAGATMSGSDISLRSAPAMASPGGGH
ncbi:hypothetical protein L226DRAFT_150193 [Lentinus tigrinus ALCF2SS1-7]|uniref:Uncharacterized protein n=1 Tax=Lentinus tigrinus ALCF2SS1-6 TaxID=1328759 RepID=A0A5C2RV72_9APHY|nr:hypothetical protein L227DRAFT_303030 [Lentinus tigrinus ALCF2SS1-6]RPD72591.1 hypothetical protein L226DRAFT_150193 [Lentinus tigrinus ALCF2SS1-7]